MLAARYSSLTLELLRAPLAAPVRRRDLHSQAIWIAHGEIVAGVALHTFHARTLDPGPQSFSVKIINADTEVIDASGLVALLQDDQPSPWKIKSMVIRSLDPSGWREAKQVSIEHLRANNIGNTHIHIVRPEDLDPSGKKDITVPAATRLKFKLAKSVNIPVRG